MRIPMIAGNWKMNTTVSEAVTLVNAMVAELQDFNSVERVLCPPFLSLVAISELIKETPIMLGAQNLYYKEKGAYTGEISPLMLAGLCDFVIIGHSERRQYFGETNETVNKKMAAALNHGLKPILCVGERLEENEAGKTDEVVTGQLKAALNGIQTIDSLTIAYEPVWAIGTGRAATGPQANETISLIRNTIAALYNGEVSGRVRILYGGSVTAANTDEFLQQAEIDGALVGGASLKASEFIEIVKQTAAIKGSS